MLLQIVVVTAALHVIYGQRAKVEEQKLTDDCIGELCWKDDDYPAEHIMNKIITEDMNNLNTFGEFGPSGASENPRKTCDFCEHLVSLKITPLAMYHHGRKFFVVNTENYLQNITVNICKPPEQQTGSACLMKKEILPNNHIPACEQKYTTIRLLCFDPESDTFVGKTVQYSSACVCTIKKE